MSAPLRTLPRIAGTDLVIAQHLADGLTNAEIGRPFGLSERQIAYRIRNIRALVGARNAPHLVAVLIRDGQIG